MESAGIVWRLVIAFLYLLEACSGSQAKEGRPRDLGHGEGGDAERPGNDGEGRGRAEREALVVYPYSQRWPAGRGVLDERAAQSLQRSSP